MDVFTFINNVLQVVWKLLLSTKKGLKITFGLKTEADYLDDLLKKLEQEDHDGETLRLIRDRLLGLSKIRYDPKFNELKQLKLRLQM